MRGRAFAILVAAAAVACGGSPAAPDTQHLPAAALRIVADPVVTLTSGEGTTLQVEETDAAGRTITQGPSAYTWTSSDPALVSAGAGGSITAGAGYGQAIVTVQSAAGLSANARIWVQPPPDRPSTYRITLLFAPDVAPEWRKELETAARRWEQVIRVALSAAAIYKPSGLCGTPEGEPDPPALTGTESGTRIYVGYSAHFPPGTYVEAVGGPCLQRPLPRPTSIYGRITLNRDKRPSDIPLRRLEYVALHEMGHTLGLAGVVQGRQPEWMEPPDGYKGPMALEAYRRTFGTSLTSFTTRGGHWPVGGDVMGNTLNTVIGPLSVGGLMDLGYPTGWYAAYGGS